MRFLFATAALIAMSHPAIAAERIEVTRFHTPATLAQLGPGWVEVVPAAGFDPRSLETRAWLDAVARELMAQGFASSAPQPSVGRITEVRLTRDAVPGSERRGGGSSVSVGIGGGSGGGWHRGGGSVGLGVGIGFPLGGNRSQGKPDVESELSVTIRDKATGAPLWEGRSSVRTAQREADKPETAARLAHALFAGFPGKSGETIEVK